MTGKWEDQDPEFSGLGINLRTGKVFREGDFVDQFAILSKGIEVTDYLSDPKWFTSTIGQANLIANIQKYHKAYLRANADLFGTADFDFVSSFIRNTKPHYVDLLPVVLKSLVDDVIITDELFFKPKFFFYEATGLSLPTSTKFDGYGDTQQYFTFEGDMYSRYIYGSDLSMNVANHTVVSNSGGFINPRATESHDSPYILAGDMIVIHTGLNSGSYPILSIINDTSLSIDTSATFETETNQSFSIYRKISNPIFQGTVTVTTGNSAVTLSAGKLSAGISPEDILVFNDGTTFSKAYKIVQVSPTILDSNVTEPGGTRDCLIFRTGLLKNPLVEIPVQEINGDPWISFVPGDLNRTGLIEIGDTIHTPTTVYTILDIDRPNCKAFVTPTPAADTVNLSSITRDGLSDNKLSVDISDLFITDPLYLIFRDLTNTVTTNASSVTVLLGLADNPVDLGIRPGDLFKIYTGPDASVDIGFGIGLYPIAEVHTTTLVLTREMSSTQNTANYAYKITKK